MGGQQAPGDRGWVVNRHQVMEGRRSTGTGSSGRSIAAAKRYRQGAPYLPPIALLVPLLASSTDPWTPPHRGPKTLNPEPPGAPALHPTTKLPYTLLPPHRGPPPTPCRGSVLTPYTLNLPPHTPTPALPSRCYSLALRTSLLPPVCPTRSVPSSTWRRTQAWPACRSYRCMGGHNR